MRESCDELASTTRAGSAKISVDIQQLATQVSAVPRPHVHTPSLIASARQVSKLDRQGPTLTTLAADVGFLKSGVERLLQESAATIKWRAGIDTWCLAQRAQTEAMASVLAKTQALLQETAQRIDHRFGLLSGAAGTANKQLAGQLRGLTEAHAKLAAALEQHSVPQQRAEVELAPASSSVPAASIRPGRVAAPGAAGVGVRAPRPTAPPDVATLELPEPAPQLPVASEPHHKLPATPQALPQAQRQPQEQATPQPLAQAQPQPQAQHASPRTSPPQQQAQVEPQAYPVVVRPQPQGSSTCSPAGEPPAVVNRAGASSATPPPTTATAAGARRATAPVQSRLAHKRSLALVRLRLDSPPRHLRAPSPAVPAPAIAGTLNEGPVRRSSRVARQRERTRLQQARDAAAAKREEHNKQRAAARAARSKRAQATNKRPRAARRRSTSCQRKRVRKRTRSPTPRPTGSRVARGAGASPQRPDVSQHAQRPCSAERGVGRPSKTYARPSSAAARQRKQSALAGWLALTDRTPTLKTALPRNANRVPPTSSDSHVFTVEQVLSRRLDSFQGILDREAYMDRIGELVALGSANRVASNGER